MIVMIKWQVWYRSKLLWQPFIRSVRPSTRHLRPTSYFIRLFVSVSWLAAMSYCRYVCEWLIMRSRLRCTHATVAHRMTL